MERRNLSIQQQLDRVKQKLSLAREADRDFQVFGSDHHQYQVNKPITKEEIEKFEKTNGITLPEDFALFLTEIGNGGAGPYYGIYKLNLRCSLFHLSKPCKLTPNMSDEEWDNLIDEEDEDGDEEDTIFTGMLNIGTQGCSYEMMLVLNGSYKGRVVYVDFDWGKPFFTYESNFLDWYERWLNEVTKGYKIFWFGMNMDGDEQELVKQFHLNQEGEFRVQTIRSMHKFPQLAAETIDFLEQQYHNHPKPIRNVCIQLLLKHHYKKAKPLLHQLITSKEDDDQLISLQYIYWYAEEHIDDWIDEIKDIQATNKNPEIERYSNYLSQ